MRYVVTELAGFLDTRRAAPVGVSVQVLDTGYCYRVVRTWRTEDYGGRLEARLGYLRRCASELAARLNGQEPPPETQRSTLRAVTCRHGHPRTAENTYVKPSDGKIECRVCRRIVQARADAKRSGRRR